MRAVPRSLRRSVIVAGAVFAGSAAVLVFACSSGGNTPPGATGDDAAPGTDGNVVSSDGAFLDSTPGDTGSSDALAADARSDTGAVDAAPLCLQSAGGGPATLIAASQYYPTGIAIDSTSVYWATGSNTILKCPLAGCGGNAPEVIASGQSTPNTVVVDSAYVYWANSGGSVARCPLAGCGDAGAMQYAPGVAKATGLAVDATHVYWTELATGHIASCPLAGCAVPTVLYPGPAGPSYGIAVDSLSVYWVNNYAGYVDKMPLTGVPDGGAPTLLVQGPVNSAYAAIDSQNIYWSDYASPGAVLSAPLAGTDGGAPAVLSGNLAHPKGIAVDPACDTIYWGNAGAGAADGGDVYRCPRSGCNDAATDFASAQSGPLYVTVDAQYVYWTNYASDGSVWRKAK